MSGNSIGDPMAAINNNVPAQTPPWMRNVSPQTMPQAMPGQIEAIAAQLAQGFAGPDRRRIANAQAAYLKDLNSTYDPVPSMKFGTTPATTTKPVAKPTAPAKPMDPWTPVTMADGSTKPALDDQPGAADRHAAHTASGEAVMPGLMDFFPRPAGLGSALQEPRGLGARSSFGSMPVPVRPALMLPRAKALPRWPMPTRRSAQCDCRRQLSRQQPTFC